jgi:hypothetical protein
MRTEERANLYDAQERRRILVAAVALATAVGCIFLLIVMLWPGEIRQNVWIPTSEQRANDKNEPALSPVAAAATTDKSRDPHGSYTTGLFGEVATIAPPKLPLATVDFIKRLARLGADRQALNAMFGPSGALSAGVSTGTRSLADIGAVVEGVNDEPAVENLPDDNGAPAAAGQLQTYPLSAAALADQQSREARYGALQAAAPAAGAKAMASVDIVGPAAQHPGATRPRAFDASEGTPLDPLLNRTYDLNFPKVVPSLK